MQAFMSDFPLLFSSVNKQIIPAFQDYIIILYNKHIKCQKAIIKVFSFLIFV